MIPLDDTQARKVEWVLRIAMFATFFGHGILAVMEKKKFVDMFLGMAKLIGWTPTVETATTWIVVVGVLDILVAIAVLWKPMRAILVWGVAWAALTALARPLAAHGWAGLGAFFDPNVDNMWDFIERFANFGVPLALLYLRGLPKTVKEWFE